MEAPRRTGHQLPPSLIWTTGIAIILFCVTGIAALMGWIPNSVGQGSGGGMPPPPPEKAQLRAPLSPASTLSSSSPLAGARGSDANSYNSSALPPPPSAAQGAEKRAETRAETRAAARTQARKAPLPAESGAPAHAQCASCGIVESVREVEAKGEGSGLGAVGGAVVGGLLGNQIGSGRGRSLATVAGAVGGVVAGNEIEKRVKSSKHYEVAVRLDDGTRRVVSEANAPAWRQGDRVRIVDGVIRAN